MTSCLIKNLLPDAKQPSGNNGLGFPWEKACPKPEIILGYYCSLLDEIDEEPILLEDGLPVLVECIEQNPGGGPKPTPTPSIDTNKLIITAYYSSCPTTIEYSIAAAFNVDDDVNICFENIIGLTTGSPLVTSVCMTMLKDTAISYLQLTAMRMYLDLNGSSTFQNITVTPTNPSTFIYTTNFYSVFEVPGCYLAVESGTPGFTLNDSILCNDGILLEDSTPGITSAQVDVTCAF
jgi:hypothetical protein